MGYSAADIVNALTPSGGYSVVSSQSYCEGLDREDAGGSPTRRSLDIYTPDGTGTFPVIVFFYGGSWQSGEKEIYRFAAASLARRGYVTVVSDYRLYPEVRYPAFLEDAAQAVAWVKGNIATFGGDAGRLFVMGHSAGAYIAAMVAIDRRWLAPHDLVPSRDLAGLIGLSGPYDFLPIRDRTLIEIFGGASRPETQPISYVTGDEPPALLITGLLDGAVFSGNSKRLAERLHAVGSTVTLKTFWNLGHLETVGALSSSLRFVAPILGDIDRFVEAVAEAGGHPSAKRPSEELCA
ncbi:Carboxylesterase NlhH [Methyloligella halotolerans]|uniref:Carboxylesterase NlhH n=1 Tax=Methyloligella halotolerans TaxID=1177755 RepID=A0A1E2RWW3_9HYPH|nr:alpha/beta hydrolase [Methyloligella halotolerans]ODA66703.1 Carboxylesterase NlhH [Methyloligella halotolerans]